MTVRRSPFISHQVTLSSMNHPPPCVQTQKPSSPCSFEVTPPILNTFMPFERSKVPEVTPTHLAQGRRGRDPCGKPLAWPQSPAASGHLAACPDRPRLPLLQWSHVGGVSVVIRAIFVKLRVPGTWGWAWLGRGRGHLGKEGQVSLEVSA